MPKNTIDIAVLCAFLKKLGVRNMPTPNDIGNYYPLLYKNTKHIVDLEFGKINSPIIKKLGGAMMVLRGKK